MAGIGFELRKAIHQESVNGKATGYMGAAFSSCGSMLVGIILFFFIQLGAKAEKVSVKIIDSFMCYVTNTMFFSMVVVSVFSLLLSRYVSNKIYEKKYEKVMPSLIGGTVLASGVGGIIFCVMMLVSKFSFTEITIFMFLYLVLTYCWMLMSYITLIRDYKWIVVSYLSAFLISIAALVAVCALTTITLTHMVLILGLCFAVVDVFLFRAVYRAFSNQDGSYFEFFCEYKVSPGLSVLGLLMMLGTLGHFGITWFASAESVCVKGLFRYGPSYDFPAIIAYFSTIPASIYFITCFETNFSEKYQKYFYLLGHGGTVNAVNSARESMIEALRYGMKNLAQIQILTCLLFVTVGGKLLAILNIGMTETMLDTFRMFCVGYSLYFIANTLVLIHLYLINEKRIVIPTALFAILTALSAFFSAKFFPNTYGVGFALVSAIFVMTLTILLVKYISKLEYNVFSARYYDIKRNTVNNNKMSSKRKIYYAITSAGLCVILMLSSLGIIINNKLEASNIMCFRPGKSDTVFNRSPGMGLAPWAESEETLELDTSLVYVELKWSDWEPQEGFYDVDFVNENFNLDFYRQDARQVVFRFICDEPAEEEHIDIPEWLFQKINADGTMYENDYGKGFSPNYNNEIFIKEHAEAIAALGDSFGNDDFFVYVELGSLGHWGEWHVQYENGITPIPEYAVREEYIKPYIEFFPNATFLIRYPLIDATNNGFGLYNDMTGDYEETRYWIEQMNGGIWEQTGLEEQSKCLDVWKNQPIGGEFASSHENYDFMVTDFDLTLESIMDSHQSFIGPKIIIDEGDMDYTRSMNKILKNIGYRYYVDSVTIDMNGKDSFEINCTMGNDGIAPIYQSYEIELSIADNEGNEVWVSKEIEFDLRNLLPGEKKSFSCSVNKENLDDDFKYTLLISVCDKSTNPVVPLAIENEIGKYSYKIAEFKKK